MSGTAPPRAAGRPDFVYRSLAVSHVGRVRDENQDDFLARDDLGLWVVADGVGGLEDGRHASHTLVETLARITPPASAAALLAAVEAGTTEANRRLRAYAEEKDIGLGTTLVALLAFEAAYACVWAGDSRLYLLRGGEIRQLSEDHTEARELIRRGVLSIEEARVWPRRNVITRAIGVEDAPELDVAQGSVEDDDVFLLCSDGLTEHLSDQEIRDEIADRDLAVAADALIEKTLRRGARDNVTLILVGARHRASRSAGSLASSGEKTVLLPPRKASHGDA